MEYLNDLINAAQSILDKGFDVQSFLGWKEVAFLALLGLLGPLHYYTRTFKQVTAAQDSLSLLAGEGILMAAKEEILKLSMGRKTTIIPILPRQNFALGQIRLV